MRDDILQKFSAVKFTNTKSYCNII